MAVHRSTRAMSPRRTDGNCSARFIQQDDRLVRTVHKNGLGNIICVVAGYNVIDVELVRALIDGLAPKHATVRACESNVSTT